MECLIIHSIKNRVRLRLSPKEQASFGALKEILEFKSGIKSVRINNTISSIVIEYDDSIITLDEILQTIWNLNSLPPKELETEELFTLFKPFASLFLSSFLPKPINRVLTLYASLGAFSKGFECLVKKGITSEVLEAIAIGISIFRDDYLAANVTNTLIELAEYIEQKIARKSENLLKTLLRPNAKEVWVIRDNKEQLVDANELVVGDIVIAQAGEIVAVDGVVANGIALINESSLSGESVPVKKERGQRVLSGTVVHEGRIEIWAEKVGRDTLNQRISEYVQSNLQVKSQSQIEASKLADRLVPIILLIGATGYLIFRDLNRVASIFQADFSCVLKLATPVAFQSSLYKAGKNGVLIKGADTIEKLSRATVFMFDKTGTLTTGELEVIDVISLNEAWSKEEILSLAASIEEHYFHPIADAVVRAARACSNCVHFYHSEVEFIVAHGVCARVNDKKVVIGSRHYLEDDEKISFEAIRQKIEEIQASGHIPLYIGYDGKLLGLILLKDTLRPEAKEILSKLRSLGAKKIVLLTGDSKQKANELAKALELDEVRSELLPEDKAEIVKEYVKNKERVVFIGDGINDALALSNATVGIAMQKGADLARVSADVVLLEDRLSAIAEIKELSNKTMKLIDTNFKIAIFANSSILLAALFGVLNPIATSILHNGTTIGVLFNALFGVRDFKLETKTSLE